MRGLWLVAGLVVLQGMDFVLTGLLLSGQVRADVYEANPLAQRILTVGGWPALAGFKAACTLVALGAALLVLRWRPAAGRRLLVGLCLAMFTVVGYSSALAAGVGDHGQRDLDRLRSAGLEVEQAQAVLREFVRERTALCNALLAGEVSLAEAVERLQYLTDQCDGELLANFRSRLPARDEPAAQASYLLRHVARMLADNPSLPRQRLAALEAESRRLSAGGA